MHTLLLLSLLGILREVALWTKLRKKYFVFYILTRYLVILCAVGYSMHAEPWMFLFIDFALRKKEWFAFKQGDCHIIVCSVSSVCILIFISNKYRNFSYFDICRYFGLVRTTSAMHFVFIIFSFKPMLSF